METNKRSLVKTITWRLTGSAATFLIAYIIIGDISAAGIIGILQIVINTVLYYIHERVWNLFNWGRNNV